VTAELVEAMATELSLKFTNTESFKLFAEGLRSLQIFQDDGRASDLSDSQQYLEKCARRYAGDALPVFYLGVVLSLLGETDRDHREEIWSRAINNFEAVAKRGPRALRANATYNRDALQLLLKKSSPNRVSHPAPTKTRMKRAFQDFMSRLVLRFVPTNFLLNIAPGATDEDQAVSLQQEILISYLRVQDLAEYQLLQFEIEASSIETKLDNIKVEIEHANVSENARQDMMADWWNIRGLLRKAQDDLPDAEGSFKSALAVKPDWLPAKRNLLETLEKQQAASEAEAAQAAPEAEAVQAAPEAEAVQTAPEAEAVQTAPEIQRLRAQIDAVVKLAAPKQEV